VQIKKTLLIAVLFIPTFALATLGERLDQGPHALSTRRSVTGSSLNYVSHSESNIEVHEYIGADGTIYAVTWRGNRLPNLNVLFGKYYVEYSVASAGTPRQQGHRNRRIVQSNNLEFHSFGHAGDLHGVAILKNQLPTDFHLDDLQ
jgi:hypothetical protein